MTREDFIGYYRVIAVCQLPRIGDQRKFGYKMAVCFSVAAVEPDDEENPDSYLYYKTRWKEIEPVGLQDDFDFNSFTFSFAVRKTDLYKGGGRI